MAEDAQPSSPYRPGFNQAPMVLAGRDEVLTAAQEAIAIAALDRRTPPPLLLVGARGVGKTVLLGEIAERAGAAHGWPHAHLEVTPSASFAPQLARTVVSTLELLESAPRQGRLHVTETVLRAELPGVVGAEVHLNRQPQGAGDPTLAIADLLRALAERLMARNTGVVLTIDEAQLADRDEMTRFAAALQEATGKDWPLVVVLAGLRSLRDHRRMPSYFERAEWHELGSLDQAATLEALAQPAAVAGRPFEPAAAAELASETGGYPYAIQLYGHHAWRASAGQDQITLAAARQAARTGGVQLERGLYAQRWAQASAREQQYLVALASQHAEGQTMTGGAVARRLGVTPAQLSQHRARLIEKGTLVAEGDTLSFTVPGMAGYVLRATDADEARRLAERGQPPSQLAIGPVAKPVVPRPPRSASTRNMSRKPKR
jgi:type II secretory pathway predicted ATPase ExeA/DNA-binding MarR family transcriptional regulator